MSKQFFKKNNKGFTLIELVIVIAIMAILTAVIVPNFSSYRVEAQEKVIIANLRLFYNGAEVVDKSEKGFRMNVDSEANLKFKEKVSYYANVRDNIELDKYKIFKNNKGVYVEYHSDIKKDVNGVGKVYRYPTGNIDVTVNTPDIPFATDDDFMWVEQNYGDEPYYALNETGKGYYLYVGTSNVVNIPLKINGNPMTSYYNMFEYSNVDKVISNNDEINSIPYMFSSGTAKTLDLSLLNTSNVINMEGVFYNNESTSINMTKFKTHNVTNMSRMFYDSCIKKANLASFNTKNVTTMSDMFNNSNVEEINFGNLFDTTKVKTMAYMLSNTKLTYIDVSQFNTTNVEHMEGMFTALNVNILDLGNFNTSRVKSMGASYVRYTDLNSSSSDGEGMFESTTINNLILSNDFTTARVENISKMFARSNIKQLDLSSFDTSNITNMSAMFSGANLPTLDLKGFDTSNVTHMSGMFYEHKSNILDLSSFDMNKVIETTNMLEDAEARVGYARTQSDVIKLNSIADKPNGLIFTLK